MTSVKTIARGVKIVAAAAAAAILLPATAQAQQPPADRSTPSNWNWEIKDGKRVPKAQRQTNADGSWREEIRQGKCVTIKEKTSTGEYKESRRCD